MDEIYQYPGQRLHICKLRVLLCQLLYGWPPRCESWTYCFARILPRMHLFLPHCQISCLPCRQYLYLPRCQYLFLSHLSPRWIELGESPGHKTEQMMWENLMDRETELNTDYLLHRPFCDLTRFGEQD